MELLLPFVGHVILFMSRQLTNRQFLGISPTSHCQGIWLAAMAFPTGSCGVWYGIHYASFDSSLKRANVSFSRRVGTSGCRRVSL